MVLLLNTRTFPGDCYVDENLNFRYVQLFRMTAIIIAIRSGTEVAFEECFPPVMNKTVLIRRSCF